MNLCLLMIGRLNLKRLIVGFHLKSTLTSHAILKVKPRLNDQTFSSDIALEERLDPTFRHPNQQSANSR